MKKISEMEGSPCLECIVRMCCSEIFGCSDLSKFVTDKTTIKTEGLVIRYSESIQLKRRESWINQLKTRVKNVLSKWYVLQNMIVTEN